MCVLDWGLGHATRSIPIIKQFLKKQSTVFIASSGSALELLKQEFPKVIFFELPSYNPHYHSGGFLSMALLRQLPKFQKVIANEHVAVEKIVRENSIDVLISDNRYGCWSSDVKSIFITHQVTLLMPKDFGWMSSFINYFLQSNINKFNEVWIPDQKGELTFPFASKRISNQKYIGWLSRFEKDSSIEKKYDIIAIISGPEPQRTYFESMLRNQLIATDKKSLMVTGEPQKKHHSHMQNLEIINHLSADALSKAIQASEIIIARSGYSTVMDLIALERHAIFVPTPQQPEQEFLAAYLNSNRIAFSMDQSQFLLSKALSEASKFKGLSYFNYDKKYLEAAIDEMLK